MLKRIHILNRWDHCYIVVRSILCIDLKRTWDLNFKSKPRNLHISPLEICLERSAVFLHHSTWPWRPLRLSESWYIFTTCTLWLKEEINNMSRSTQWRRLKRHGSLLSRKKSSIDLNRNQLKTKRMSSTSIEKKSIRLNRLVKMYLRSVIVLARNPLH